MTFHHPCGHCDALNAHSSADVGKPYACHKCKCEWLVPLPPSGLFVPRRAAVAVAPAATPAVPVVPAEPPAEPKHGWLRTVLFSKTWYIRYPRLGIIAGVNMAMKEHLQVIGAVAMAVGMGLFWETLGWLVGRPATAAAPVPGAPDVPEPDLSDIPDLPG